MSSSLAPQCVPEGHMAQMRLSPFHSCLDMWPQGNMKNQDIAREGCLSCRVQIQEILRSPRACPDLIKCTKYRKVSTFNIQMTKNKHPLEGLKTH